MKAQDFRIGNLITHKGVKQIIIGIDVDKKTQILHTNKNSWLDISEVKPIQVNQGILIKLGFEKYKFAGSDTIRYSHEDCRFDIELFGERFAFCIHDAESCPHLTTFICHGDYLHQLQNSFYALAEMELVLAVVPK